MTIYSYTKIDVKIYLGCSSKYLLPTIFNKFRELRSSGTDFPQIFHSSNPLINHMFIQDIFRTFQR